MVPLKYLRNFWRTLEIPLVNCEINLILTWSANSFIISNPINDQVPKFTITDIKLYVPVVTLSTQDNVKLLQQLNSGFQRTNNCNKHQSKIKIQTLATDLDYLIDPSFQEVNRLFVLSFENKDARAEYKRHFLPTAQIKHYIVTIDGQNFFNKPVKNDLKTYENIQKN